MAAHLYSFIVACHHQSHNQYELVKTRFNGSNVCDDSHAPPKSIVDTSYGYGKNELMYHWTHGVNHSIKMASDMALSQFDLIGFPAGNETDVKPHRDAFSVLYVTFRLKRHMGYFLINVYVPCSLLVIISWVGFWINREATSDRIALGFMTVLTMALLRIDNRRDLPEVSYSTALDYFLGACFGFILATIIQFAGVHYFTKNGSGEIIHDSDTEDESDCEEEEEVVQNNSKYSNGQNCQQTTMLMANAAKLNGKPNPSLQYKQNSSRLLPRTSSSSRNSSKWHKSTNCCYKFWNCLIGSATYKELHKRNTKFKSINSVSVIDKISRFVFPIFFIAFNVFYWVVYLEATSANMLM